MPARLGGRLRHDLVLYDTDRDFLSAVVPFVDAGLSGGETVVVQLPPSTWKLLGPAVSSTDDVIRNPLDDLCPHPHQGLWAILKYLQSDGLADDGLRVVAQVDPATRVRDSGEWARLEAVINHVFRDHDLYGLCTYDRRNLPAGVVEAGLRTHRRTTTDGDWRRNRRYREPREILRGLDSTRSPDPLEATTPMAELPLMTMADLAAARQELEPALQMTLLSRDRRADFVAAVFEVAVNALLHGGPTAALRVWVGSHRILCLVRDSGSGLADPLMGYEPPGRHRETSGHGLWTARQLCDAVSTTAEPEGFTVRLSADF